MIMINTAIYTLTSELHDEMAVCSATKEFLDDLNIDFEFRDNDYSDYGSHPFNMVERYEFDTHFESGIGIGIRGYMKEGPVTIFKVSGRLSRYFAEEGELIRNQAEPDLCRTQQVIRLCRPSVASYFLTDPIGNHHIILPGHHKELIEEILR